MKKLRLLDALHLPENSTRDARTTHCRGCTASIASLLTYEIAHTTIHDLRCTVGSHAAMAGVSLHIIGGLLGHTSARATGVYARLSQDALRDAATRASITLAAPAAYSGEVDR